MTKISIPRKELDIVYVMNFYDLPLKGLCRYQGKIQLFETDYETEETTITLLSTFTRLKLLWRKKLFEICIGNHWTYKNGKRTGYFYWRNPEWFHRILYNLYFRIKK